MSKYQGNKYLNSFSLLLVIIFGLAFVFYLAVVAEVEMIEMGEREEFCVTEYWLDRKFGKDRYLSNDIKSARELAGGGVIYSKRACF